jgi:hypothetical protein
VLSALIGDAACHRAGSRLRMLALPSEKVKAIGPRHDLTKLALSWRRGGNERDDERTPQEA